MSAIVPLGGARPERCVLVTGGAGFIGSAVCRHLVAGGRTRVINLDKLTYAGSLAALADIAVSPLYRFVQGDIADRALVSRLLAEERVDAIMHLAAESHVDRSIDGPAVFIETNITGTFHLLEVALDHWRTLEGEAKARFRFHHIWTDEVFGDLPFDPPKFGKRSPYCPSLPHSASKAVSNHPVRAWNHTFGLPVVLSKLKQSCVIGGRVELATSGGRNDLRSIRCQAADGAWKAPSLADWASDRPTQP